MVQVHYSLRNLNTMLFICLVMKAIMRVTAAMKESVLSKIAEPNLGHCITRVTDLFSGLSLPEFQRYLSTLPVLREVTLMAWGALGVGFKHLCR